MSLCSWEMCPPILLKWWTKCKGCMPGRTTWTSGPSTAPKKVRFDTSFFFVVLVGHRHVVFGPMWDLMCIVHLVIFLHVAMICFNHVQQNLAMFYYQIFTYSMFRCSLYKIKKLTKNEFIESFGQRKCILFIHALGLIFGLIICWKRCMLFHNLKENCKFMSIQLWVNDSSSV